MYKANKGITNYTILIVIFSVCFAFTFLQEAYASPTLQLTEEELSSTASSLTFKLGNTKCNPGDVAAIDLTVANIPVHGVHSCTFDISYDSSILKFDGIDAGSVVYDKSNDITYELFSDRINVKYKDTNKTGTSHIISDGSICNLKFKALAQNKLSDISFLNISIDGISYNDSITGPSTVGGSIQVAAIGPKPTQHVTFKIGETTCRNGEIANVELSLDNVPKTGYTSFVFELKYDKTKLQFEGVYAGTIIYNKITDIATEPTKDGLKILYGDCDMTGNSFISSNGLFCTLKFKASGDNEKVPVAFYRPKRFDEPEINPYLPLFINGAVNIINTYGDANNDNIVDSADYTILNNYLIDKIASESVDSTFKARMDLYADNIIDSADYMALKRFLLEKIDKLPIVPSE